MNMSMSTECETEEGRCENNETEKGDSNGQQWDWRSWIKKSPKTGNSVNAMQAYNVFSNIYFLAHACSKTM